AAEDDDLLAPLLRPISLHAGPLEVGVRDAERAALPGQPAARFEQGHARAFGRVFVDVAEHERRDLAAAHVDEAPALADRNGGPVADELARVIESRRDHGRAGAVDIAPMRAAAYRHELGALARVDLVPARRGRLAGLELDESPLLAVAEGRELAVATI